MKKTEKWQERADRVLDDLERGAVTAQLTQTQLAEMVGVCRQTLWRDKRLTARLTRILELRRKQGAVSPARANMAMRVRALQGEVARLKAENGLLIENFVLISRRLREQGLDPRVIVGEAADDVTVAGSRLLSK